MTDMIYVVAFPLVSYCKGRKVSTSGDVVCKQGNSQKNVRGTTPKTLW